MRSGVASTTAVVALPLGPVGLREHAGVTYARLAED